MYPIGKDKVYDVHDKRIIAINSLCDWPDNGRIWQKHVRIKIHVKYLVFNRGKNGREIKTKNEWLIKLTPPQISHNKVLY